jgi:hypothetical protein
MAAAWRALLAPHPLVEARQAAERGGGRGLFATRDIAAGEFVLRGAAPLAVALRPPHQRCDHCLSALAKPARCGECKRAPYCSRTCQLAAWPLHKLECPAWRDAGKKSLRALPSLLLVARVAMTRRLAAQGVGGEARAAETCLQLEAFDSLEDNLSRMDASRQGELAEMAALVSDVAALAEGDERRRAWRDLAVSHCNSVSVTDDELRDIGIAAVPAVALLNHSCLPNCVLVFVGEPAPVGLRVHVRAVRRIGRGEELTIAYTDVAESRAQRRASLARGYFFQCRCARCEAPAREVEAKLEGLRCGEPACDGVVAVAGRELEDEEGAASDQSRCSRGHAQSSPAGQRVREALAQGRATLAAAGNDWAARARGVAFLHVALHRFNAELRKETDALVTALAAAQQWEAAADAAVAACESLEFALGEVAATPWRALGLQRALAAKLLLLAERDEAALANAEAAVRHLAATGGDEDSAALVQARATAAEAASRVAQRRQQQ